MLHSNPLGFSISQNLLFILLHTYRELVKFILFLLKLLKLFSCENSLMKVASLSSSCTHRLLWNEYITQVGIASMCLGAIWVEIEKSWSETDQSRGKQAASAGSCAVTEKTAFPNVVSLISFDRWLSWLPRTFIKEDKSCWMSSLPEWLWLIVDCKENRAHNHLSIMQGKENTLPK